MDKEYRAPEIEVISFNEEDTIVTSDCGNCFYLVCEPQDNIIG